MKDEMLKEAHGKAVYIIQENGGEQPPFVRRVRYIQWDNYVHGGSHIVSTTFGNWMNVDKIYHTQEEAEEDLKKQLEWERPPMGDSTKRACNNFAALFNALKEAMFEHCDHCFQARGETTLLADDIIKRGCPEPDGTCFVQKWLKLLQDIRNGKQENEHETENEKQV